MGSLAVSGCRLAAGVFGRNDWCLGQQVGRSGAWVHGSRLQPVFTWIGLVFDSAVMRLEHVSSWVDIDSGPSGINQMLGTTGMNAFSGYEGVSTLLGWGEPGYWSRPRCSDHIGQFVSRVSLETGSLEYACN